MADVVARGMVLLARCWGDEPKRCRLVTIDGDVAYITDDKGFIEIESGEETANITAFLVCDLYLYNLTGGNDGPDWSGLTPLRSLLATGGGDE
jgi:hypothetical protein